MSLRTLSPSMETKTMEMTTGAGAIGDSARIRVMLTISGDSGSLTMDAPAARTPSPTQRIAVPRGAVPFTNLSGQTLELVLRRARAVGGDTVLVPLLLPGGPSLAVRVPIAMAICSARLFPVREPSSTDCRRTRPWRRGCPYARTTMRRPAHPTPRSK